MENYTPIGMVKIEDENGNVLVEKHNMIVKKGRELIFNNFKSGTNSDIDKLKLAYKNNVETPTSNDEDLKGVKVTDNQIYSINPANGNHYTDYCTLDNNTKFYNTKIVELSKTTNGEYETQDSNYKETVAYAKIDGYGYIKITGLSPSNPNIKIEVSEGNNPSFSATSADPKASETDETTNITTTIVKPKLYKTVVNDNDLSIDIYKTVVATASTQINELGLFVGGTPNDTLFSRLVFETITLTAGSSYTITYSIYF